jgi:hypothetical protein
MALEGRLILKAPLRPDEVRILRDDDGAKTPDRRLTWPDLTLDLVSDGDRVIPAPRGVLTGRNPAWDWVVEPGQVWSEPGDGGDIRVSLPVALEERNANCVHNGSILLRLKPDGRVTRAFVQFAAETCVYYRFDAWSVVSAHFRPGVVAGAKAAIDHDRAERAARAPTEPIAVLASKYPTVDLSALAHAAGPGAIWGVVDAGAHYVAPCETRAGEDTACDTRDLPSYSTAKTLVAAQALMRLETLYPGSAQEKVADHVQACRRAGTWGDVRLVDLLDMASGHYVSAAAEADENSAATEPFFLSQTQAKKLAFACSMPRKDRPGQTWVYHTADTFLLGAAMTDVLRQRAGPDKDIYDDLIRPIWNRLNQSATLDTTRRTYDPAAQPFSGWGLTYTRADIVRAAMFLARGAKLDGAPTLEPALLAAALQQSWPGAGLVAGAADLRYLHGFWARDISPLIGCGHPVWIPFLSGYGGISVVLFPNDVQFYAFGDEGWFDWSAAAVEINKIRSLCR